MLESAWQNLALYPRWFVVVCAVLVGGAALWLVAKIVKWTLTLVLLVVVAGVTLVLLFWWLT